MRRLGFPVDLPWYEGRDRDVGERVPYNDLMLLCDWMLVISYYVARLNHE